MQVRIIYDKKSNQKNNHSTIGYLAKLKNIQTCFLEGKRSQNGKYNGLMHSKMAIIDDKIMLQKICELETFNSRIGKLV